MTMTAVLDSPTPSTTPEPSEVWTPELLAQWDTARTRLIAARDDLAAETEGTRAHALAAARLRDAELAWDNFTTAE